MRHTACADQLDIVIGKGVDFVEIASASSGTRRTKKAPRSVIESSNIKLKILGIPFVLPYLDFDLDHVIADCGIHSLRLVTLGSVDCMVWA